jgi:hypothetical protein
VQEVIIGLSGYAQTGKDTVANYLVEKHGFKRLAFADAIRDLLYEVNPIVSAGLFGEEIKLVELRELVDYFGWEEAKVSYPEIRRLLQELGTGIRNTNPSHWIQVVGDKINSLGASDVVITDVRFPNEVYMIENDGLGEVWRVVRPKVEAVNDHISETALDKHMFKHILNNDSDLYDLHTLIDYYLGVNKRSA